MRRKIEFVKNCPACGSELDLNVVNVQCKNKNCPAVIAGRIINFCNNLRIQQIGHNTLKTLSDYGYVKEIIDLFKLKNKAYELENLPNFGRLKTRAIINEIEKKRELFDYELLGAIGIGGLSLKSFKDIFKEFPFQEMIQLATEKRFSEIEARLLSINGFAEKKAEIVINYFKDRSEFGKLLKLMKELKIKKYENNNEKPIAVISGFRDKELIEKIEKLGYEVSDKWTNKAAILFVRKGEGKTKKELLAEMKQVPVKYV